MKVNQKYEKEERKMIKAGDMAFAKHERKEASEAEKNAKKKGGKKSSKKAKR